MSQDSFDILLALTNGLEFEDKGKAPSAKGFLNRQYVSFFPSLSLSLFFSKKKSSLVWSFLVPSLG